MAPYHKFDRDELRRLMNLRPRPSYAAIGAALGVSAVVVWKVAQRLDTPVRSGNYRLSTGKAGWQ